jgi:hypothetical protein
MVGCVHALRCAMLFAVLACLGGEARAAGLLELNFWLSGPRYDGVLPACDAPSALEEISSHFASKESRFWNSDLTIVEFERLHETAYRPWDRDLIPRRFCSGVVRLSDGRRHAVHYWIGEGTGMIGASWGVGWCVVGLDRNWAYNPACKMAKP